MSMPALVALSKAISLDTIYNAYKLYKEAIIFTVRTTMGHLQCPKGSPFQTVRSISNLVINKNRQQTDKPVDF